MWLNRTFKGNILKYFLILKDAQSVIEAFKMIWCWDGHKKWRNLQLVFCLLSKIEIKSGRFNTFVWHSQNIWNLAWKKTWNSYSPRIFHLVINVKLNAYLLWPLGNIYVCKSSRAYCSRLYGSFFSFFFSFSN